MRYRTSRNSWHKSSSTLTFLLLLHTQQPIRSASTSVIPRVGQNRIYTYINTVYLVISKPKIPYVHRIYMVLANPSHTLFLCNVAMLQFALFLRPTCISSKQIAPTYNIQKEWCQWLPLMSNVNLAIARPYSLNCCCKHSVYLQEAEQAQVLCGQPATGCHALLQSKTSSAGCAGQGVWKTVVLVCVYTRAVPHALSSSGRE